MRVDGEVPGADFLAAAEDDVSIGAGDEILESEKEGLGGDGGGGGEEGRGGWKKKE